MKSVSLPLLATTSLILTPVFVGLVCQASPLPSSHRKGRESSQSPAFEAQRPTSPVTPTYPGHPLAPFGSNINSQVNRDNDMSNHRVEESESSSEHPHQVAQNASQVASSSNESSWQRTSKGMEEKIVSKIGRIYGKNSSEAYKMLEWATGQDGEDLANLFNDSDRFKAKVDNINFRRRTA